MLSLLPLRALYFMSDILFFPFYYCVRYRRKVVRKNLVNSFPEKSTKEIIQIEKKYYSFLCDYLFETLKLLSISEKEIRKRMTFEGIEAMEKAMSDNKPCIICLGHYCNWEWVTSIMLHLNKMFFCGQVYQPLKNIMADKLFLKIRGRFHANNIPREKVLRKIAELRQENKNFIIGFISDQTPNWASIRLWIPFLNQDTPVFLGPERIARQTGAAVFYADMTRIKRGYYHCKTVLISEYPKELQENVLTEKYFKLLEENIKKMPQFWLWSHNRWKRQRK